MLQPRTHQPLSHGGFGFVYHPEQRAALFFCEHGLRQLQIALGVEVEPHILRFGIQLHVADALKTRHLGFFEISDQGADRAHEHRLVLDSFIFFAELLLHGFGTDSKRKAVVLQHFDAGGQLGFDKAGQRLYFDDVAAEQDLARTVGRKLVGEDVGGVLAGDLGDV